MWNHSHVSLTAIGERTKGVHGRGVGKIKITKHVVFWRSDRN